MKRIGLTGGIGSGKSTVAMILNSLSVPVLEADALGRTLLAEDISVIDSVKALLGEEVYVNGVPDRKRIASLVFNNDELLEALNAIIHPAVRKATEQWFEALPQETAFAVKEAAILFESGSYKHCDAIITVVAKESIRIERVIKRDGVKREDVLGRMAKQWSDDQRIEASNYVIDNNGTEAILPQVFNIVQKLMTSP